MTKHVKPILALLLLGAAFFLTYPALAQFFDSVGRVDPRTIFYAYHPQTTIIAPDTSSLPQAKAVPILMYHGVVAAPDQENTLQSNFVAQMEMLKENGYQTITLQDFENWRDGKYTLPHRPIIITFDDGRKDSYYPTDDVLKKLGFSATIFLASGKANNNESFFLSWPELIQLQKSGRWDIEAHGQFSHDKIPIDGFGAFGRFLNSKEFIDGQLETTAEFEQRVQNDYESNIADIKKHLGKTPRYFSIPLNDYGEKAVSNYAGAVPFNRQLIQKYFKLAFIQVNDSSDVTQFHGNVYNYADDDPLLTKRIEVKNMNPEVLRQILDEQYPAPPDLSLSGSGFSRASSFLADTYGLYWFDQNGLNLASNYDNTAAAAFIGDNHWTGYRVQAKIQKRAGASMGVAGYVRDKYNYVFAGITDYNIFLREVNNGVQRNLAPPVKLSTSSSNPMVFVLDFKGNKVSVMINNKLIYSQVKTAYDRGALGFKVWDESGKSNGLVSELLVSAAAQ